LDLHLNSDQIDALLQSATDSKSNEVANRDHLEDARRHLKDCADCQTRLRAHEHAIETLALLNPTTPGAKGPICSPDEVWLDIAAGIVRQDSENHLSHAAQCDHCGPLLRQAKEDFAEELTPTEEQQLVSLESQDTKWRSELAAHLSHESHQPTNPSLPSPSKLSVRNSSRFRLSWVLTIAAMAIVCVAASLVVFKTRGNSVQSLLEQAYAEQRPFELRISGASYGPLQVTRGAGGSQFSRPTQLLKAEAMIATELPNNPNDSAWQSAKGTADLLERNYDKAIESLKNALIASPESIPIQINLATAYSQRGEEQNQPWDQAAAVEVLKSVLKQQPHDPVALFNLAIVVERQGLYHAAVDAWTDYLKVDSTSPWADEARKALERDKQQIGNQSSREPLIDPPALATALRQTQNDLKTRVDQRFEEYLSLATSQWISRAVSPTLSQSQRDPYLAALSFVAQLARTQHNDAWLSDLLRQSHGASVSTAAQDLSKAVEANELGDHAKAALEARRAAHGFLVSGSRAGSLRAQLEEVYSARLSHDAATCAGLAKPLIGELRRRHYAWAHVQATLELQECLSMLGQMGQARLLSDTTMTAAQSSRYPILYLRALLFTGDVDASVGDLNSAWRLTNNGLLLSWSKAIPAMRTYSFEMQLDMLADKASQRQFESVVLAEAVKTIEPDHDILLRAMAHERFAEAASAAGDYGTAEEQFRITMAAFSAAPKTPVTANHWLETKVGIAKVEGDQRNYRASIRDLMLISQDIVTVSNRFLVLDYYRTLGRSQLELGEIVGASRSMAAALHLTESALETLSSDKDRSEWNHTSDGIYRDAVELRLRQHDEIGALELWEWYKGASIRAHVKNGAPPAAARPALLTIAFNDQAIPQPHHVRDVLQSLTDKTVVSFAFFHSGLAIWVYDNRGVRFHWVEDESGDLLLRATRFAQLCADPASDRQMLSDLSRKLYDTLLGRFADLLSPARVLILEPDGPLWAVPMQALMNPDGKYLADLVRTSEFPGLYYAAILPAAHLFRGDERAVIVASAAEGRVGSAALPQLPNVPAEAKNVASKFHASTIFREDVTMSTLENQLSKAQVFHFAGHALTTQDGDALIISAPPDQRQPGFILTGANLSQLPLKSIRLAVLSACSTGSGIEKNGPLDPGSLAGAFLRGGVPEVVASDWVVDSVVTQEFMDAFYQTLLTEHDTPESVRAASNRIRARSATSHPYYWAAFTTFGWA
jgi:CHAT domain-containing protein/cytochrome c-type biogenesis protein CcmH/NrfG